MSTDNTTCPTCGKLHGSHDAACPAFIGALVGAAALAQQSPPPAEAEPLSGPIRDAANRAIFRAKAVLECVGHLETLSPETVAEPFVEVMEAARRGPTASAAIPTQAEAALLAACKAALPFVAHFKGGWSGHAPAQISANELSETLENVIAEASRGPTAAEPGTTEGCTYPDCRCPVIFNKVQCGRGDASSQAPAGEGSEVKHPPTCACFRCIPAEHS